MTGKIDSRELAADGELVRLTLAVRDMAAETAKLREALTEAEQFIAGYCPGNADTDALHAQIVAALEVAK